ncbi:Tlg2-vesicle protein [Apiotrichum porosum]|uniref:Golgi apparatus membrane protein TVP38 n=1 Tax=Apiotrichum porosum TaxID=105984 RepID=A0A427XK41_9TREE|nr:Tlg2-vesicle protein [Apiotrichum porosum]RSH79265.1 Tlg2-vesicle protein [Apiotrichum porosum]
MTKDYGAIVKTVPASDESDFYCSGMSGVSGLSGFSSSATSRSSSPGGGSRTPLLSHQHRTSRTQADDEDLDELTAAERREYERGLLTWDRASNWRFWIRREWIGWYALGLLLMVGVSLVAVFHRQIIHHLMPFVYDVRGVPFGWIVPIGVIAVLSFPPLFGNEIVLLLTGLVWGFKRGSAIVAAGTLIGELASFTVFRTCCRKRASRFSRQSLNYACLSRVIEEGGLFVAWLVRLSAVPTHVSTVIFAVCGLDYPRFISALLLSLPKQLIAVYVGVVVTDEKAGDEDRILSDVVLGVTIMITLLALWDLNRRMLRVRKRVFLEMREDLKRHGVHEPPPPGTPEPECESEERA